MLGETGVARARIRATDFGDAPAEPEANFAHLDLLVHLCGLLLVALGPQANQGLRENAVWRHSPSRPRFELDHCASIGLHHCNLANVLVLSFAAFQSAEFMPERERRHLSWLFERCF